MQRNLFLWWVLESCSVNCHSFQCFNAIDTMSYLQFQFSLTFVCHCIFELNLPYGETMSDIHIQSWVIVLSYPESTPKGFFKLPSLFYQCICDICHPNQRLYTSIYTSSSFDKMSGFFKISTNIFTASIVSRRWVRSPSCNRNGWTRRRWRTQLPQTQNGC